jgi:hypothetical protein
MASKCILKLARFRPPGLHDQASAVYVQTRSITILECIYMITQSQAASVSPMKLDYRLLVHLQTLSIPEVECISEFTRLSFSGTP